MMMMIDDDDAAAAAGGGGGGGEAPRLAGEALELGVLCWVGVSSSFFWPWLGVFSAKL